MVVRDREWSCAAVVRGRARWSCVVVRGRAWSCAVVRGRHSLPFCPLRGQRCRDARKDGHTRGRTTYNTPLNPPGVGWVNFFYPINVIVSIRTCVPNLGSIRGSVRKKLPFKFNTPNQHPFYMFLFYVQLHSPGGATSDMPLAVKLCLLCCQKVI